MIDESWYDRPLWQKVLFVLALIGFGYLLLQMRSGPSHLSKWQGFANRQSDDSSIVGQAVAQIGRGQPSDADLPFGNPLGVPNTVMTQGYGVGSHAPAYIWGAVDLAIDSNGDGRADPEGSWNQPVYATHRGIVQLARNTWPAGNHIWLEGQGYKTGYAHLSGFAVDQGQTVERGQLIGYIGSSGDSSGPHLDYQVWENGVNVNPLDYGALN